MSDLCVLRAVEPAQDEALSHLVGVGIGRAITAIGDHLGTRLTARPPVLRFVSTSDDPHFDHGTDGATARAVRADLNGSIVANAMVWIPEKSIGYFGSRVAGEEGWRENSRAHFDVASLEFGSIALSALTEGLRPILPERGWFTRATLVTDVSRSWQQIGHSAVGGFLASVEIEDAGASMEFDFALLTGPRGLDMILNELESLLAVA